MSKNMHQVRLTINRINNLTIFAFFNVIELLFGQCKIIMFILIHVFNLTVMSQSIC
ncbi:hypothetical protein SAMN04487773_2195 [Enterobacter sp. kpr-6]|nr:hypothetical protein SAMN04487773_2195 [Enterobacter sp. kpr-6]